MNDNLDPLSARWDSEGIKVVYAIQKIVFCAYRIYRSFLVDHPDMRPEKKPKFIRDKIVTALDGLQHERAIGDFQVSYDPSTWGGPVEPLQICLIDVRVGPPIDAFRLRLDLFKDEETGVSIWYPVRPEWVSFDATRTEFLRDK